MTDNIRPAREGYASINLDFETSDQEVVANMFIHEGELREQDAILDLLIKMTPPVEGDTEFIQGYKAGYVYAMHVISERVHGPAEPEVVESQEVDEEFDITDVDDPE
jgi:hypothetical protein